MLTMWQFWFVSGSRIYLHSFEWGGTFFQDVLLFYYRIICLCKKLMHLICSVCKQP